MSSSDRQPTGQLNRTTQFGVTILLTAIIVGVVFWLFGSESADISQGATVATPSEPWPTPVQARVTPTPALTPNPTSLPTHTPTPIPTPTPIVIGSFAELGTLISLEATLQTIVELKKERTFPLAPERILLAAVGNVEAGVDLTQIDQHDIRIEGSRIQIVLPPAQVTSVELLPGETEIFDSSRGWILSEYQGLEVEALDTARTQLENWAVERNNLLTRAEDEAKAQLDVFLRKLGFEEVIIRYERDE